jgi:hypothetical protein
VPGAHIILFANKQNSRVSGHARTVRLFLAAHPSMPDSEPAGSSVEEALSHHPRPTRPHGSQWMRRSGLP